jgi:hypothetical protein
MDLLSFVLGRIFMANEHVTCVAWTRALISATFYREFLKFLFNAGRRNINQSLKFCFYIYFMFKEEILHKEK